MLGSRSPRSPARSSSRFEPDLAAEQSTHTAEELKTESILGALENDVLKDRLQAQTDRGQQELVCLLLLGISVS